MSVAGLSRLLLLLFLSGATQAAVAACPSCVPLDDLSGPPHHGYPPGLYPGVSNSPPPAHLALALDAATQVVPRNVAGNPSPAGLVGFLSIGMSNTNQEFTAYQLQEDGRIGRDPRLILINGAVGGQSADSIANPAAPYWTIVLDRVHAAGLDANQVQVAWLKEAEGTVPDTTFPLHADTLRTHLRAIVRHMKDLFPNLSLCYMASRTYGGYTTNPARSEPLSYETAFAVRGLIEEQITGSPLLNADPDVGPVEAPVLLWGPYLWTNGSTPRSSDGLVWLLTDVEADHIHPSPSGEIKVATLLSGFFGHDATAAPWQDADPLEVCQVFNAVADAFVHDLHPLQNYGGERFLAWMAQTVRSYTLFDLQSVSDSVFYAGLTLRTPPDAAIEGVEVVVVSNTTWDEYTINASNAPQFDGPVLGTIPEASRGSAISIDVTAAVRAALASGSGAKLCLGLRPRGGSGQVQQVLSRESGDAPRLVLGLVHRVSAVETAAPRPSGPVGRISVYPQPLAGNGVVRLTLLEDVPHVAVEVFDAGGRRVYTLYDGPGLRGERTLAWQANDSQGRRLAPGIYLVRATTGVEIGRDRVIGRKLVLIN
jgi:hypothetical protein